MKLAFKFDDGRIVSHEVYERHFTIGRSPDCRVQIESDHFSREHAMIELVDDEVFVTDQNSKNGVFINHIRIPKKMRTKYDLKLPLYIGECYLTIDITEDKKDPDHLSLETYSKVNPEELYRPLTPPKRIPSRPKPTMTPPPPKSVFDKKSLLFVVILLGAIGVFTVYRPAIFARFQSSESGK